METAELALERLCDPAAKVSAHYVVDERGRVFSLIDETKRAWHAGVSAWGKIKDINSASIGIEIVNGGHDFGMPDFTPAQITAVTTLCQEIISRHTILPGQIVGHNEIAPDRKLDPGEKFPWAHLAAAGIGIWPKPPAPCPPDMATAKQALAQIGYATEKMPFAGTKTGCVLSEFQRRYLPKQITGQLCPHTMGRIVQMADCYKTLTRSAKGA